MERRRMNLPTGPDTLCFDKDEFMKVRDTLRRGGPMPRPCGFQALRRVAGNGAVRLELHSDMKESPCGPAVAPFISPNGRHFADGISAGTEGVCLLAVSLHRCQLNNTKTYLHAVFFWRQGFEL